MKLHTTQDLAGKMNIIKRSVEISCTRILSRNNPGSILNISPTFLTPVSNVSFGNQFSTLEKGKIPSGFKTKNGILPGTTLGNIIAKLFILLFYIETFTRKDDLQYYFKSEKYYF